MLRRFGIVRGSAIMRRLAVVAGLAAALLAWPAIAQDLPKTLICHSAKAPPYTVVRGRGITGIDVDQLVEVGRRVNIQFDFAEMPIADLEQEILKGPQSAVACAFSFTKTPEREPHVDYTHVALHQQSLNFFMKGDVAAGYKNLASLKGKTVGTARGLTLPPVLAKQVAAGTIKREEFDDEERAFQKLLNAQIDAVLTDAETGSLVLRNARLGGVSIIEPAVAKGPTYLIFPKGKVPEVIVPTIDDALRKMASDGAIKTILLRYR
jgi:ABC-type amino acid transport substrate-binding protein